MPSLRRNTRHKLENKLLSPSPFNEKTPRKGTVLKQTLFSPWDRANLSNAISEESFYATKIMPN